MLPCSLDRMFESTPSLDNCSFDCGDALSGLLADVGATSGVAEGWPFAWGKNALLNEELDVGNATGDAAFLPIHVLVAG